MSLLSEGEKEYIVQGVEQGLRTDGRGLLEFRALQFELGIIPQASGSARLHLGPTDVIVAVKAELGSPDPSTPDWGRVEVTVECSSVASPQYQGRGGDGWGSELAKALETSLQGHPPTGSGVNTQALSVIAGKSCWVLHVDGLVLNDGGNVLDALSLAARAALDATRIPKVDVIMGEEEGDDPEIEVDNDMANQQPLDTSTVPIIVTVSQIGRRCVVDLSSEEEPCAPAALHIAVTPTGKLCGMTADGYQGMHPSILQEMLDIAQRLGQRLAQQLRAYVAAALQGKR